MNLDKLFSWIIATVAAYAMSGHLNDLQSWIIRAQAKLVYESRSETWGSPRFIKNK